MTAPPIRTVQVVSVGDELLLGEIADTNFQYLAARLFAAGVRVERHVTVGDEAEEIRAALKEAVGEAPLVVVMGGLGVTPDDQTRQALADLAGVKLVADPDLVEEMEIFYRDRKIRMPSINIAQASLPQGAQKIPNRVGLAPGIHMRVRKCELFALPGVPAEMRALTEEGIVPFLEERNREAPLAPRVLRTWGLGENALAELLAGYLAVERPVTVAFLPQARGIVLRFRLVEGEYDDAAAVLDRQVDEAASILGDLVYSTREEELEDVVGYLLTLHRKTVAVAESCTGGRVADLLTSAPGSSAYFREGFVPYDARRKIETLGVSEELIERAGTVSAETASALARQARTIADTDIGVGVTGVAGPERVEGKPVGRVYIALDSRGGTLVRQWDLPGNRGRVKERAARHAINMIRLHLLGGLEESP